MAGGRFFTTDMNLLLHNQQQQQQQNPRTGTNPSQQPLDSLFLSSSVPFFGRSRSMVSFKNVQGGKRCNRSFFGGFHLDENGDDEMNEYFHQSEKKCRLSVDQVQFLEKSFDLENKLEPERKTKLAKDLGLQPRQVSIWFQNRRARWKNKMLEKDYESLNDSYESLKTDYEKILIEKDRLQAEVASLTEKVVAREKQEGKMKQGCESEIIKGFILQEEESMKKDLVIDSVSEDESKLSIICNKQENISSTRSDILECDSSYVFEPEYQSDLSQDDDENLLNPYIFTKFEDINYSNPLQSSSSFGFQEEDHQHVLWPWSY